MRVCVKVAAPKPVADDGEGLVTLILSLSKEPAQNWLNSQGRERVRTHACCRDLFGLWIARHLKGGADKGARGRKRCGRTFVGLNLPGGYADIRVAPQVVAYRYKLAS